MWFWPFSSSFNSAFVRIYRNAGFGLLLEIRDFRGAGRGKWTLRDGGAAGPWVRMYSDWPSTTDRASKATPRKVSPEAFPLPVVSKVNCAKANNQ